MGSLLLSHEGNSQNMFSALIIYWLALIVPNVISIYLFYLFLFHYFPFLFHFDLCVFSVDSIQLNFFSVSVLGKCKNLCLPLSSTGFNSFIFTAITEIFSTIFLTWVHISHLFYFLFNLLNALFLFLFSSIFLPIISSLLSFYASFFLIFLCF